jgi:hypothetical protein
VAVRKAQNTVEFVVVFVEGAAGGNDPQSHDDGLETQKNKVGNDSRKRWCIPM